MAVRTRQPWKVFVGLTAGLLGAAALSGCGKSSDKPARSDTAAETKQEPLPAPKANVSVARQPVEAARFRQSFFEATRKEPPPDQRPPDRTMTDKSVGKLYSAVVRLWDTIRFHDAAGRRLVYSATLETELGNVEIALNAEAAPNHVRNFIALARAGYYDGLVFDRVTYQEGLNASGEKIHYEEIEAGCPLGTGDFSYNSIGYWLKPEFDNGIAHEVGTVGACRGIEEDTAACKFYITLSHAPYLDGNYTPFGRVTSGMDVARKIYAQPIVPDDQNIKGSRRPQQPVVIRKVTIQTRTVAETKESVSRR